MHVSMPLNTVTFTLNVPENYTFYINTKSYTQRSYFRHFTAEITHVHKLSK